MKRESENYPPPLNSESTHIEENIRRAVETMAGQAQQRSPHPNKHPSINRKLFYRGESSDARLVSGSKEGKVGQT